MSRRPVPAIERLLRVVVKSESCWLSPSNLRKDGYSSIWQDGKPAYAHRVAFEHFKGPVPDGMEVDHTCAVRNCVNPDHLEAVTPQENMRRMAPRKAAAARNRRRCASGRHEWIPENIRVLKQGPTCRLCTYLTPSYVRSLKGGKLRYAR